MPKRSVRFAAPAALSLALGAQGAMQVAPDWPQPPEGWKLGQGLGGRPREPAHSGFRSRRTVSFAWKHVGRPIGLALGPDGSIWVADANDQRIVLLRRDGTLVTQFGTGGDEAGQLGGVHHIAVGPDGALYTAELRATRFQKFVKR